MQISFGGMQSSFLNKAIAYIWGTLIVDIRWMHLIFTCNWLIQKITKKCSDCDIRNSCVKDASRNDQYFDSSRSFLLNMRYFFFLLHYWHVILLAHLFVSPYRTGPLKLTKADYRLVWCPLLRFVSSILVMRPHVFIRKEQLTLSDARCHSS